MSNKRYSNKGVNAAARAEATAAAEQQSKRQSLIVCAVAAAVVLVAIVLALVLGGMGVYGYITRPEFWLGNPVPHIIVSGITAAVGLGGFVWFFVKVALKK